MQDSAQPSRSLDTPREPDAGGSASEGTGEIRFATLDERDAASVRLERTGHLVAELEGIGPSARGRLGEAIDEAIEEALSARGATAPGITSGSDRDATLSDQLFRARRVGGRGLAIVLGPLRAATNPLSALEPEDSATLRFLADATRERPLVLILDGRDAVTGSYGDPVPLRSLLVPQAASANADAHTHETSPGPPPPPPPAPGGWPGTTGPAQSRAVPSA
jgi:hypothetical protein